MSDGSLEETIALARRIFNEDRRDADAPVGGAAKAYRMPSTTLRDAHEDLLQREASTSGQMKTRRMIIAGGPKHYCASRSLDRLEMMPLRELSVPGRNRGKAILLRISSSSSARTTALQVLAQDENDWTVPVSIYHASAKLESLLLPDTIVLVAEPWLKEGRDGYFIRIDSPSDLHIWPEVHRIPQAFRTHRSLEQYRKSGSVAFIAKRCAEAASACYEAGLFHYSDSGEESVLSVMRLNAAAAYLAIGMPGHALAHAQAALPQDLSATQRQKRLYREALSLYRLQRYEDCVAALVSCSSDAGPEPLALLQRAHRRLHEVQTGRYDWQALYASPPKADDEDVAEYCGPVETRHFKGKGRGLISTRAINTGELLLVAQSLALVHPDKGRRSLTLGLNLVSESLDTYTQVEVVGRLIDRAADDGNLAYRLANLYAGSEDGFAEPTLPGSAPSRAAFSTGIDAGRLEGICTFNSFKPECITRGFEASDEHEDLEEQHLHSSSALYHLPSMINHACIGNASFVFFGDVLVVRACRNMEAGTEVLFSYCDAASPLPERRAHLRRYGFECTCSLCDMDAREGASRIAERGRLMEEYTALAGSSRSDTPERVLQLIRRIDATYAPKRTRLRPELYCAYRLYSRTLSAADRKDEAYESDICALEALGAVFSLERPARRSQKLDLRTKIFLENPVVALQDATISCLKLAHECQSSSNDETARAWLVEAGKLHELEFGPKIFRLRMQGLVQEQGWQKIWESLDGGP